MSDLERIFVTAAVTVLVGVSVFAFGQVLLKFLIEPVHELRKAIAAVRFSLLFFAPDILTPIGRTPESSTTARNALLKNSADLYICCEAIRGYSAISFIFRLPEKSKALSAAKWLRGLSTYMHETGERAEGHIDEIRKTVKRIETELGLQALGES